MRWTNDLNKNQLDENLNPSSCLSPDWIVREDLLAHSIHPIPLKTTCCSWECLPERLNHNYDSVLSHRTPSKEGSHLQQNTLQNLRTTQGTARILCADEPILQAGPVKRVCASRRLHSSIQRIHADWTLFFQV